MNRNFRPVGCTGSHCEERVRSECLRYEYYKQRRAVEYTIEPYIQGRKCTSFVPKTLTKEGKEYTIE